MFAKLALPLRIILGAVFLYAAWTKLRQPWLVFALSIDAYRLLPAWAVFAVARTLPWIELGLGGMLLSGLLLRYAAPAVTALLVLFYAGMIYAYAQGAGIDCGCFGVGETVSPTTLLRDGLLLLAAVCLTTIVTRRTRLTPALHTEVAVT